MDQLQFKISSALKDLVGKDLITSDNVAIFELVKNSYDAYASKVDITFADDKIIIADNGKGMSFDEIKNNWLFLGFSEKKNASDVAEKQHSYRDKIKRYYAGAKGIGRFSCDRLGRYITLTTSTEEGLVAERIYVDWKEFEKDQRIEFANVNVGHEVVNETIHFPQQKSHGTIIEITNLHDEEKPWTRKHILELKRSLEKLINPISETNDFAIEIICKREEGEDKKLIEVGKGYDRNIVNGILKNSIANIIKLKTTQIDVRLEHNVITTTLSDRGVDIYRIKEENKDFRLLEDATVTLSFLNRAAKYNFHRIMGIEVVNYGSVFLFRNGFRILPFGETGDDSWRLDFRAQQGYNRYLGSRDLLGRVDIHTEHVDELKEVSSRDGGLVDTPMARQVMKLFETAHRRLERYVAGVLWGEAFLRNEYYSSEEQGKEERKKLQAVDKDAESPDYVLDSSLGSKVDFIRLIKSLSSDENVDILYYNTELANLLGDQFSSDMIKPQFISDLEQIAQKTGDDALLQKIDEARQKIEELNRQKEEAERKAAEAERRAALAEEEKLKAEQKAKEEEEKRRAAEIARLKAENERINAENAKLKAEKKATEEEEKRKKAEKDKKIESLKVEFYRKATSPDTDALIHHVKNNNSRINDDIDDLMKFFSNQLKGTEYYSKIIASLSNIRKLSMKSLMATDLILNCDLAKSDTQKVNLPLFIVGYLKNEVHKDIKCHFNTDTNVFAVMGSKLDLGLILDNFISNSVDWHAQNLWINCSRINDGLVVDVYDDGDGLAEQFNAAPDEVFNFATSGKKGGTGFGMYLIRESLKDLNATIEVAEPINNKGIHFRMLFK